MDTDHLSSETYKAIIVEAEKFNHDLTLQFGVLADSCKNEMEYIANAKILIEEFKNLDANDMDDLFFGSPPPKKFLLQALDKISANIMMVEKIPEKDRHYDF